MKQLILGGARSGKSSLAESLAQASGKQVIYLATTDRRFNDSEMEARISHHRQQRPAEWPTVEEPVSLASTLLAQDNPDHCILVDCLTLWVTNCLFNDNPDTWQTERQALLNCLPQLQAEVIMVSNEVGMGVIPLGDINRRFVDETGFLHQAVGQLADRVVFTAAGLPLVMKGPAL